MLSGMASPRTQKLMSSYFMWTAQPCGMAASAGPGIVATTEQRGRGDLSETLNCSQGNKINRTIQQIAKSMITEQSREKRGPQDFHKTLPSDSKLTTACPTIHNLRNTKTSEVKIAWGASRMAQKVKAFIAQA